MRDDGKHSPTTKFEKNDSRLFGWDSARVVALVKAVFPLLVESEKLDEDAVKFLQLWDSGTYFQAGACPVLMPGHGTDRDLVVHTEKYFKDVIVRYRDKQFRLLRSFTVRSAPVLLNWLLERHVNVPELIKTAGLPMAGLFTDYDDFRAPIVYGGNKPLLPTSPVKRVRPKRLMTDCYAPEELMATIPRLSDGSIAAKDVKGLLAKQLKLHKYTRLSFADGAGFERRVVSLWLCGDCVIHPDELQRIYKFLGIKTMFDGL